MTFHDIPIEKEETVVFFPQCLRSTLHYFLDKAGITGFAITGVRQGMKAAGISERPYVPMYLEMPEIESRYAAALISHFNAEGITKKIYSLHEDLEAVAYRDEQAALLMEALTEDGLI